MSDQAIMKNKKDGSTQGEVLEALHKQDQMPATPDAMTLIATAVQSGAGMESVQQLIELVKFNDSRNALQAYNAAFTRAQAEFPEIKKASKVGYTSKGGDSVNYIYASFKDIVSAIRPTLIKHGFSFRHDVKEEGNKMVVTCILAHEQGHSESASLSAVGDTSGKKNPIQAVGSTVTYLKRYTLEAVTGVVTTDEDDDGEAAGTEYIDDKQYSSLVDLLADVGLKDDDSSFLAFCQITELSRLPKNKYQTAVNALKTKKAAQKEEQKEEQGTKL